MASATTKRMTAEEVTGNAVLPDLRCRVADFFFLPGEAKPASPPAKPARKERKKANP